MENGHYRARDLDTISTSDWIRLNFDEVQQDLLVKVGSDEGYLLPGDDYEEVRAGDEERPEEPDDVDFESDDEYEAAHEAWETACAEWDEEEEAREHGLPMWNTMWAAQDSEETAAALLACGFSVYRPVSDALVDVFGNCLLFGVDGAGYSFYGQHWLPLRAAMLTDSYENEYIEKAEYARLLGLLLEQSKREGEGHRISALIDALSTEATAAE